MKARQLELRGIPQFDSGRWKLRLERVPVHSDNETTRGMDFDSAAQASVTETNEASEKAARITPSTMPIMYVSSLCVVYCALRVLKKSEAISKLHRLHRD